MQFTPRLWLVVFAVLLFGGFCSAQQPSPIAPHARLMAARTICIQHAGGRIPNDVIGDAFQGWGRYQLVGDPATADLIVSIVAPQPDSDFTAIRLLVLDAHDRAVLWSGSEQSKSSFKEKQREDYLVDASLRLFRRFRATIEPEP